MLNTASLLRRATALLIPLLLFFGSPTRPSDAAPPPELCTPPIQPVPLVTPTVITDCSNQTQLEAALASGGHITFSCGPNPVTIPITSEMVTSATADIVLDGQGLITLDGQNSTRILKKPFTPGSENDKTLGNDLTLQNIHLINAKGPNVTGAEGRGGAVTVTSPGTRLHVINATFENNRTTLLTDEDNQGGAIFAANIYETVIVGSEFINNEAGNGGAFGAIASGLQVYNTRFANNAASDATSGGIVRGHGGAIHLDGVTNSFNPDSNKIVDICGSTFENNTAVRGGGAIKTTISDNKGTKATFARSTFTNNRLVGVPSAEGHGGAIYHIEDDYAGGDAEDNIEIRESTFDNNYAYQQGGAAWILVRGQGRIINSTFHDNKASQAGSNRVGQGGGLILSNGVIDIVNSTFAYNFATFQGGAIFAGSSSQVTLTNSLFYANRLDPTHTNPATSEWQGYHTNRSLLNGGGNLQYPRTKVPDFNNDVNNLITTPDTAILFADPLLGALTDNGGPTATMALGTGSPAINAGGAANCPVTDQRGISRPQGSGCDIGAFEAIETLTTSPTFAAKDEVDLALTVYGSDFTGSSQIIWRGAALSTTVVNSNTLQATVPNGSLGAVGQATVTVSGSTLPAATVTVVESLIEVYLPILLK